ncbi:hypothetical protein [Chondrinema litorale]|uniref:hypothetical protein n=1 Tax=Chondrinema litorale TaxID=2994555 RepID=UPI0025433DED|nr:hypothetical protein [Chondrinema litorale]UZR93832.1 hypothetical protein OQ292_18455 [Chondrinema litorale]
MQNNKLLKSGNFKIKFLAQSAVFLVPLLIFLIPAYYISLHNLDKNIHPFLILLSSILLLVIGFYLATWIKELIKFNWFINAFVSSENVFELKKIAVLKKLLEEEDLEDYLKGKTGFPIFISNRTRNRLEQIEKSFKQSRKPKNRIEEDVVIHYSIKKILRQVVIECFSIWLFVMLIIIAFVKLEYLYLTLIGLIVLVPILFFYKDELKKVFSDRRKLVISKDQIIEYDKAQVYEYDWRNIKKATVKLKTIENKDYYSIYLNFNNRGKKVYLVDFVEISIDNLEMAPWEISNLINY